MSVVKKSKRVYSENMKKYSSLVGIDLDYFLRGGFWLGLAQGFAFFKYFILSFLFANLVSKDMYGQYTFIMGILGLFAIFAVPGLIPATVQSVSKKYDGNYSKALKYSFKFSLLGALSLFVMSVYAYFTGKFYIPELFLFLGIVFPVYAVCGYYMHYFNGRKEFLLISKISLLFNFLHGLSIVLAIVYSESLMILILANVITQSVILGYISFFYVKGKLRNNLVDQESLKFGRKISWSKGFMIIVSKIDTLIVGFFLGFTELAIYTIVTLIPNQFKVLSNTFIPLFLPKLASQKSDMLKMKLHFLKYFLGSIFVIVFYFLIAPLLFKYIYPEYYDYVWLSIVYSIGLIVLPYSLLEANLQSKLKASSISRLNFFVGFFLLISVCIGVFYGLIGVIVSRIVHRIFILVLGYYITFRSKI